MTSPSAPKFAQPPSGMDRAGFVAFYGRVYENSPWIAERLFDAGLTPVMDRRQGLAAALRDVVEAAGADRQLALLLAHPDLAGRLAIAGALTPESAGEQAGAGLDKCAPAEFRRFTDLNDAYKAKFGFPFILAVKGKSRADILEAFARRIGNDRTREFRVALDQVHRIAELRLAEL